MHLIDTGHRRISQRIDLTRVQILGLLADASPLRPREIADRLGLTASATSRHLAALERDGRVAVGGDPSDARTFLVSATADGTHELQAVTAAGAHVFAGVIADWPDEDVNEALRLITALNTAWARHHAAKPKDSTTGPRSLRQVAQTAGPRQLQPHRADNAPAHQQQEGSDS